LRIGGEECTIADLCIIAATTTAQATFVRPLPREHSPHGAPPLLSTFRLHALLFGVGEDFEGTWNADEREKKLRLAPSSTTGASSAASKPATLSTSTTAGSSGGSSSSSSSSSKATGAAAQIFAPGTGLLAVALGAAALL
jgi:hypothetical protein